jgi:hypothetical protein
MYRERSENVVIYKNFTTLFTKYVNIQYMYIQFVFIFIIIVLCAIIYSKKCELFKTFPTNISDCTECEFKNQQTCRECNNCGYCIYANGDTKCISGDRNGPDSEGNCIFWEYGYPINNPSGNTPTQYYFTGFPRLTTPFNRKHKRTMQYTN